jgi:endonuclease/exonuclease/phosphatase (EEP) superfamily protein YafD
LYRWIAWPAVTYALGLILVIAAGRVLDARRGILGLAAVFGPYLFVPVLVLVPLALRRGAWGVRLALAAAALVWAGLYAPGLVASPARAAPGGLPVRVASWNIHGGNTRFDDVIAALRANDAGVVSLQEFSHAEQAAIAADAGLATRYPYQILRPQDSATLGMALLSAYPILEQGALDEPPAIWAKLDLGDGRTLRVIGAHPQPAGLRFVHAGDRRLPVGYEPQVRDAQIARLRALIAPWLAAGDPLLLAGDFNVTEREPGYRDAAAGLLDAQRIAGSGPGLTWQPVTWPAIGRVPMLRIDYLLGSPRFVPLQIAVDCTPRGSDHCLLNGTFSLAAVSGS